MPNSSGGVPWSSIRATRKRGPGWTGSRRFRRRLSPGFLALVAVAAGSIVVGSATASAQAPAQDSLNGWQLLDGTRATARYRGSDSLRATRALAVLDAMSPLRGLGEVAFRPLVTIAADKEEMDSLVGGRIPEWSAAVALPGRMEMILPGQSMASTPPIEEARIPPPRMGAPGPRSENGRAPDPALVQ